MGSEGSWGLGEEVSLGMLGSSLKDGQGFNAGRGIAEVAEVEMAKKSMKGSAAARAS